MKKYLIFIVIYFCVNLIPLLFLRKPEYVGFSDRAALSKEQIYKICVMSLYMLLSIGALYLAWDVYIEWFKPYQSKNFFMRY